MSCTCGTASSSEGKHERQPLVPASHAQCLPHHVSITALHLYFVCYCKPAIIVALLPKFSRPSPPNTRLPARRPRLSSLSPRRRQRSPGPPNSLDSPSSHFLCIIHSLFLHAPSAAPITTISTLSTATACGPPNLVPPSRTCFVSRLSAPQRRRSLDTPDTLARLS
jgi:hypothetical protein